MSFKVAALVICVCTMLGGCWAQLSPAFYNQTCPNLSTIVSDAVSQALQGDVRAGAKLIRFHFHDCFVNGCDGSVLLEDADGIDSELNAPGNGGIQGFDIVDNIKAAVEAACPATVSCADILAIASRESSILTGGPSWDVQLGRRDSRTANRTGAESNLPSPFETLDIIQAKFTAFGLDSTDLVALSGAHTFGRSRCVFFSGRLNNFNGTTSPDPTMDPTFRDALVIACPTGDQNNRIALDVTTPDDFDNAYYTDLVTNRGLLQSDQELLSTEGADTIATVNRFASSQADFFAQFGQSMINMGNILPLVAPAGEIRANCRRVNPLQTVAVMFDDRRVIGSAKPFIHAKTCPNLTKIVNGVIARAQIADPRAGAKLIRLHFHDCFVNGCDAVCFAGECKSAIEKACPRTVSCADILTIASKESVVLTGGPSWIVPLGRRDSRTANRDGATNNLASPFEDLNVLKAKFAAFGLDSTDLVALSGAHTFGRSRCGFFSHRFANFNNTNKPDPTLDSAYRQQLQRVCSSSETRVNFDPTTPGKIDKNFYTNLLGHRGLLQSDQELFSTRGADTVAIVNRFARSQDEFFKTFGWSMIKMGNISPLIGNKGEIRLNCRRVNPSRHDGGHDIM